MLNEMWTSLRQWTFPDALRIYPQSYESHADIIAGLCRELQLLDCQLDGAERRQQEVTLDELKEELLSPFAEATLAEHLEAMQTSLIEQRAQSEARERQADQDRLQQSVQSTRVFTEPLAVADASDLPPEPHTDLARDGAFPLVDSSPATSEDPYAMSLQSAAPEDTRASELDPDLGTRGPEADETLPTSTLPAEFAIALGNALHALEQTTRPFEALLKGKQQKAVREAFERVARELGEWGVEYADLQGQKFEADAGDFEASDDPRGAIASDTIAACTLPRVRLHGRVIQPARGTLAPWDTVSHE